MRLTLIFSTGRWNSSYYNGYAIYIFLFIFSFYVTLIMLNIVIAIASESYVWAKENGPLIFRALRIEFLAEVISVEEMFGVENNSMVKCTSCISKEQGNSYRNGQTSGLRRTASLIILVFLGFLTYATVTIYMLYSLDVDGQNSRDALFLLSAVGSLIGCVVCMLVCFSYLAYAALFPTNIFQKRKDSLGLLNVLDHITYAITQLGTKVIGFLCNDN